MRCENFYRVIQRILDEGYIVELCNSTPDKHGVIHTDVYIHEGEAHSTTTYTFSNATGRFRHRDKTGNKVHKAVRKMICEGTE